MTEISVFRPGDVSYLRIAAPDPSRSSAFYNAVFGWKIRKDSTAFEDGTGHIIGHFMPDLPVAGEAGVIPYVYVQDIDEALAAKYPYQRAYLPIARKLDGTLTDW